MTKNIVPWESLETEELAAELWDYHYAVHNFRPRYTDFTDRSEVLRKLHQLDEHIKHMKSTESGREYLRSEGWVV